MIWVDDPISEVARIADQGVEPVDVEKHDRVNRPGSGGGSHSRKDESCGSSEEVQRRVEGRATRMALEARRDPATSTGAIKRVADQLGIHPEALRTWVDAGMGRSHGGFPA
jgi:hypothetical protein